MSDPSDHLSLASSLREIARRAGEAILDVYERHDFDVRKKTDDSPVTAADLAANAIIRDELGEISDLPILSEESEQIPWNERRRWETFWLVDPLDGTKEFINRNGEFTVNIALIRDGRPVLGVVHAPALGRTYWGSESGGASCVDDAGEREISVRDTPGNPVVVVVSRSHLSDDDRAFIAKLEMKHGAVETRPTGSALKLCLVAEGTADVYPRFGPTMEWDIAAAHAVLVAAGGVVQRVDDGQPLVYNKRDLVNPSFLAHASGTFWRWGTCPETP